MIVEETKTYIYEYPVNECIRLCLKIEPLLKQLEILSNQTHPLQHKNQILLLINIINILDRQDIKTKFIKLITQQQTALLSLQNNNKVDQSTLQYWVQKLRTLSNNIQNTNNILDDLKQDKLINLIIQQQCTTYGIANFMVPQLQCWLQLPDEYRIQQIAAWKQKLSLIESIISTLLPLIRNTAIFQKETVTNQNFFQTNLITKERDLYLIRIKMYHADIYPEISVGKHRLIINFLSTYTQNKNQDIKFEWLAALS